MDFSLGQALNQFLSCCGSTSGILFTPQDEHWIPVGPDGLIVVPLPQGVGNLDGPIKGAVQGIINETLQDFFRWYVQEAAAQEVSLE